MIWLWLILFSDPTFETIRITGQVSTDPVNEASGLAASRSQEHVLWTHNDSGDTARVFALHRDGRFLAEVRLKGAKAIDNEDLALGPGPEAGVDYLFLADIGNNRAHDGGPRRSIQVYRFKEPKLGAQKQIDVASDRIELTYPDPAHDAECLFVDPQTGDLYLITKRNLKNRIYRLPKPGPGDQTGVLEFLGEMNLTQSTAADISPDGREILVKNYPQVFLYRRSEDQTIAQALMSTPLNLSIYKPEPQGEAITFDAKGWGFYTLSEAKKNQKRVPIIYYPRR